MSRTAPRVFFEGLLRIMYKPSNVTVNTTRSVPQGEETLAEKVAVAAAFVLCVSMVILLGGVI